MALSFSNATANQSAGGESSLTFSHTNAVTVKALYLGFNSFYSPTSVTYAGANFTNIANMDPGTGITLRMYELKNPASGTNNISITLSGADPLAISAVVMAYTETKGYDVANTGALNGSTANVSVSVTTTEGGAWLVGFAIAINHGSSVGAETTSRAASANGYIRGFDSNGPKNPAGSYSLNANDNGTTDGFAMTVAAINPEAQGSMMLSTYI